MAVNYLIPPELQQMWGKARNYLAGGLQNIFDPNQNTMPPQFPGMETQRPQGLLQIMGNYLIPETAKAAYESGMIGMGPMPLGVKKISRLKTKQPWEMSQSEFNDAASKGRIIYASGKFSKAENDYIDKGKVTDLGAGLLAKYSPEDISHFYLNYQNLMGQPPEVAQKIARKWLIEDAIKEGKIIPSNILEEFPELIKKHKKLLNR